MGALRSTRRPMPAHLCRVPERGTASVALARLRARISVRLRRAGGRGVLAGDHPEDVRHRVQAPMGSLRGRDHAVNRYRHGRYKFIYVGIDFADAHDFKLVTPSSDAMGWLSPLE